MLVVPGLCAHIEPGSLLPLCTDCQLSVAGILLLLAEAVFSRCCRARASSAGNHDQCMFCGLGSQEAAGAVAL